MTRTPVAACVARPGDDRTAQAALPGPRRPVQEPDRDRARPGHLGQHVRCLVVAVIDEDELGAQRRDGRSQPRQQQVRRCASRCGSERERSAWVIHRYWRD